LNTKGAGAGLPVKDAFSQTQLTIPYLN